ncbi:MAG: FAD-dependent oxidoreductase [Actinomycetales bacterium]|nr:FAD-dependent oxidoreductase [Actinomycetales bacterium]
MEVDVVVLGTGGAGLTAALAAHDFGAGEVLILEKFGMIGGTSAMSGGMLWIPLNDQQADHGVEDSYEEIVTYVDGLADEGHLDPETFGAFLEEGPEMLRWFEEKTPVRLRLFEGFPDYQSWAEGAKEHGSRSLDNDVFPFVELGSWAKWVNPPKTGWPRRTSMIEDYYTPNLPEDVLAEREERDCRGQGQALIGSLLKGVLDRGIPLHRESRAQHLITDGRTVVGVVTEEEGRRLRIGSRKGVIIATGGFEWNEKLVHSFLRGPMTGPVSVPECEGDGLLMAMEVGASLGNMGKSWWLQSSQEMAAHGRGKANYLIGNSERTRPRSILVNRAGKRFVNEATNYNAIGPVLHNFDANTHDYPNLPFWIIVDRPYVEKYRFFNPTSKGTVPDWAVEADTIEELGEKIGVDAAQLAKTVATFNADVVAGRDTEFGRGDNTYDQFWGDKDFEGVYRTLGTIDTAPFYAVKMESGVLGTCGGPRANANAQVIDWDDRPIEGLYVCSNAMSSSTAGVYGGAGGTLGPGMTFGFIAGRHAAQRR